MLGPLGRHRIRLLLYLSQVGAGRLTNGERRRGLGAGGDVHLFRGGQLHGLVLRRLEDARAEAGGEGAPGPAVPAGELDRTGENRKSARGLHVLGCLAVSCSGPHT